MRLKARSPSKTRSPEPLAAPQSSVAAIHIQPLTSAQDLLLRAFRTHPIVIAVGAAGTGKTFIGVNAALNEIAQSKTKKRLVLTRTNVPTGRSLGFMPGDIKEKLEPWLAPMLSEFKRRTSQSLYENWLRSGRLELLPLETVRGRSFEDTVVLVDEAQNLTVEEVKSLVTRVGEDSKLVLMGDLAQRDTVNSGLEFLMKTVVDTPGLDIPLVLFSPDDIVRSDIVARLVKAFSKGSEDLYERYRYYAWTGRD